MRVWLRKSIPAILLIALLITMPFSLGNGCPVQVNVDTRCVPEEGGYIDLDRDANYSVGEIVGFTAVPAPGYVFSHWGGDAHGESEVTTITITGDIYLEAYFVKGYKLTAAANPPEGGSVSVAPSEPLYKSGTTVDITASEAEGYFFTGWTGTTGITPTTTVTMDKDKTITANFVKGLYLTTSVSPAGSGSVSYDPPGGIYKEGTEVTATAKEVEGYRFDHWYGAAGDKPTTTVKMDADKTVTAHFSEVYKLTTVVEPPGGGTVSVDPADPNYTKGTMVTIFPKAANGYRYDHLTDENGRELDSAVINVDKDRTITAHFVKTYKLNIEVDPPEGGHVWVRSRGGGIQGNYDEGTELIITAEPKGSHKFSHWSGDASGEEESFTFNIFSDMHFIAHFF
jgi:uncharacterized repeat protein (TIGR02543 family)